MMVAKKYATMVKNNSLGLTHMIVSNGAAILNADSLWLKPGESE